MARPKESSEVRADIEEMVLNLEERVTRLENERVATVNNQFEIWMDHKIRGYAYGPDLKKIVMPKCVGRTSDESKKIFFTERDKLVRERFPDAPLPMWV